jgi:cytochrome d ubiquinol oxidase subunit II
MTISAFEQVFWLALGTGLIAYVLTGGADLGAGVWDLLARGPRRDQQRRAIKHALAPIWEANHVWLIFVVVVMFSAFPRAFAVITTALHIPIGLCLIGLVFRGAALVFHAYGIQAERARSRWSAVFAWSSPIAPLFFGAGVAALSSGEIRLEQGRVVSGFLAGWAQPFAWVVGCFTLALCALLAACYLCAETSGELQRDFARRALAAELIAGALAFCALALAREQAPLLFRQIAFSPWTFGVQFGAAAMAVVTIALLTGSRRHLVRFTAPVQVALVILGWGLAMDHHFVLPALPLSQAGAEPSVMPLLLLVLAVGGLLLTPAFVYLMRVFKLRA